MATKTVSLIRGDSEINTLKDASEARNIAGQAIAIHEEEAIARLINNAVNTGNYSCRVNRPLSDTIVATLTDKGYNLTQEDSADPRLGWIISW